MGTDEKKRIGAVTVRAFVLGVLLSGLFAWLTALMDNATLLGSRSRNLSANLLPALPHVMLLLACLLVNPLLRRLRVIRLFTKAELLLIFVMTAVSSGVATWGLNGSLIPIVSGLSNKAWNTDQSQWDVAVMPFMNENYFIVEEGTQDAAKVLREVHLAHELARKQYRTARDLLLARAELTRIEADLEEIARTVDPDEREGRERAMVWPHGQAIKLVERTEEEWEQIGGELDPQVVVDTYADKIKALRAELGERRLALKEKNAPAFDSVEKIRKGLPVEQRATPGFFYTPGEGFASYSARIRRLRIGGRSRRKLESAEAALVQTIAGNGTLPADWAAQVREAAELLTQISDIPALSRLDAKLSAQLADLEDRIAVQQVEARRIRHLRRYSQQNQFEAYNNRIAESDKLTVALKSEADALREQLEIQIRPLLAVRETVKETHGELLLLAGDAAAASPDAYAELLARLQDGIASYAQFDASSHRFWLGEAEWGIWVGPIFNWLTLIFLAYLVFMTFNTLIFRQWAHNEKLIYPLAEITTLLAGGAESDGTHKPLFRSGLFWVGFSIAAGILGWNYLATSNIVPNINPVKLQTLWIGYVSGLFRGLASTYFCVIFAVIGISFLVPSSISFSLWFFEVLYMVLLLVMVWLGYGDNRWSLGNVGRSGLGSGAMVVFGLTILWTCRRYLLCAFTPGVLKGLERSEARELRVSSALFLGASVVLMMLLTLALGANPFYVVLFFLVVLTMTIALIRAVAEGGVLGIESHAGVFGIIRTMFGFSASWSAPVLVAPLLVFNALLFGGFRAFIAPMMANALKVREEFRMRRLHFHGAIWAGILVAVLVSAVTLILLSYQHGADNMNSWLNTSVGRGTFDGIRSWVDMSGPVKPSDKAWMFAGAVLMAGLLFGRQRIFGIPHPIGLLMLMNPNMFGFWGSILIGWGCKSIVSKYCTHEQYVVIRRFFVGLVLGHLVAVLFGWDPLTFHWG